MVNDHRHDHDPLRNPRDPLHKTGPEAGRYLFRAFAREAHEFPNDAVVDASVTVLINVLRQTSPDWPTAERGFNDLFGRAKQILKDHYDAASGRKKGIFAYDQIIHAPLVGDKDRSGFDK